MMKGEYLYETFRSESNKFDQKFTDFLNGKRKDHWKVKDCSYCHEGEKTEMWASCIFERKPLLSLD